MVSAAVVTALAPSFIHCQVRSILPNVAAGDLRDHFLTVLALGNFPVMPTANFEL